MPYYHALNSGWRSMESAPLLTVTDRRCSAPVDVESLVALFCIAADNTTIVTDLRFLRLRTSCALSRFAQKVFKIAFALTWTFLTSLLLGNAEHITGPFEKGSVWRAAT